MARFAIWLQPEPMSPRRAPSAGERAKLVHAEHWAAASRRRLTSPTMRARRRTCRRLCRRSRRWPSAPAGADAGTRQFVMLGPTTQVARCRRRCPAAGTRQLTMRTTQWSPAGQAGLIAGSCPGTAASRWRPRRSCCSASAAPATRRCGCLELRSRSASRLWDYRDKWVGLALPLLLTVIGTAFGVTRGGQVSVGEGVHEGWVYAVVISRIAAALGAGYLSWRTLHGRRPPAVPPWNRPHKIG